jgi:hypothetical protein
MSHRTLIGKPAPIITLPNYDGEEFTLTPGVKGPTVIFFYPKAGMFRVLFSLRSASCERAVSLSRFVRVHQGGVPVPRCYCRCVSLGSSEIKLTRARKIEKDTYAPGKIELVGISPDPVEKQKAFVEKHKLTVCTYIFSLTRSIFLNAKKSILSFRTPRVKPPRRTVSGKGYSGSPMSQGQPLLLMPKGPSGTVHLSVCVHMLMFSVS